MRLKIAVTCHSTDPCSGVPCGSHGYCISGLCSIPAILKQAAKTMIHALQLTVVETEIVSLANVDATLGTTMILSMALIVTETEVVLMVCVYATMATLVLVALIAVQL